jgi:hypothetical protein
LLLEAGRRPHVQRESEASARDGAAGRYESTLIISGVILLVIGFIAKVAIIWTIGILVVVVSVILALLGSTGHAIRGRRHYF